MALEETLKVPSAVFQAVAVVVTAYFASKSLNAWRRQSLGKRRIEVAEEMLVAAYRAQSAIEWIRNPGAFGDEGSSRPRGSSEPDEMTKLRDSYFVPLERIQKQNEELAQFSKVRVLAQVYFGPSAIKPIDEVMKSLRQVALSARMLISTMEQRRGFGGEKMARQTERWEGDIWGTGDEKDEIANRVKIAMGEIEELCRSHLKDDR